MAYEGELVKLANGRWARFQHVSLVGAKLNPWDSALLVAVELDERYQKMLDEAARDLDFTERSQTPQKLRLEADGEGEFAVMLEEATVH